LTALPPILVALATARLLLTTSTSTMAARPLKFSAKSAPACLPSPLAIDLAKPSTGVLTVSRLSIAGKTARIAPSTNVITTAVLTICKRKPLWASRNVCCKKCTLPSSSCVTSIGSITLPSSSWTPKVIKSRPTTWLQNETSWPHLQTSRPFRLWLRHPQRSGRNHRFVRHLLQLPASSYGSQKSPSKIQRQGPFHVAFIELLALS